MLSRSGELADLRVPTISAGQYGMRDSSNATAGGSEVSLRWVDTIHLRRCVADWVDGGQHGGLAVAIVGNEVIRQRRWEHLLPETTVFAASIFGAALAGWVVILLPSLFRAALLASVAVHGLGHVLAAGGGLRTNMFRYLRAVQLRGLIPFAPIFIPGLSDPARAPAMPLGRVSRARCRWIALAGPAANALVLCALAPAVASLSAPPNLGDTALVLLAALNLWVLATSWTDYATAISGTSVEVFCGNFGILAKRDPHERGFLPPRFRKLAERLGQETDIRGQQAGGIAVLAAGGRFVGRKVVNEKRGNLTCNLLRGFRREAAMRRLGGIRPLRKIFHLVAHYRYGTSSGPSVIETHWHRWLRPRTAAVWSVDGPSLVRRRRVIENLITHNGDFDAWDAPGGRMPNARLGAWLGEVLGTTNPARGDSPKIAGMLDLLLTQGQWDASLRQAYALQTGQALPIGMLKSLTRVFEQVFMRWASVAVDARPNGDPGPTVVGCPSLVAVYSSNPTAIQSLLDELQQASLAVTRDWPETAKRRRQQIVVRAVHAFFHNDLYKATQLFMARAEGTFGLVTTTSLQPGAAVLAADRQPLFVGTDPTTGVLLYASEAAALKSACGIGLDGEPVPLAYRYDLRDGDMVLLQVHEDTADNTMTVMNRRTDAPPVTERITPQALEESARDGGVSGWIALHDNPCVEQVVAGAAAKTIADRVLAEMRDIPVVLDRVQREWDDPTSLNWRTAHTFSRALLDNACQGLICRHAPGGPGLNAALDLIVLGIENNFALAQRFVEDLRRMFPYLHVVAVDAISYCEAPQRFAVGPSTLTLAVSQ